MRFSCSLFNIIFGMILLMPHGGVASPQRSCTAPIAFYEKHHQIPTGLLHAMSKVESGRKATPQGDVMAWPWTINVGGKGYYFRNKEEAIRTVRLMQARGITSIDVGCLQVNLAHHPHAFKTLEEAFEPEQNVAYAAHFLKKLKNEHKTWAKAVAHYHSAHPIYHRPYQKRVFLAWAQDPQKKIAAPPYSPRRSHSSSRRQSRVLLATFEQREENPAPLAPTGTRKITRAMLLNCRY